MMLRPIDEILLSARAQDEMSSFNLLESPKQAKLDYVLRQNTSR